METSRNHNTLNCFSDKCNTIYKIKVFQENVSLLFVKEYTFII